MNRDEQRPEPALQPWQQRVVDERTELEERKQKLNTFLFTDEYWSLDVNERNRLTLQFQAMTMYSLILQQRIAAFSL